MMRTPEFVLDCAGIVTIGSPISWGGDATTGPAADGADVEPVRPFGAFDAAAGRTAAGALVVVLDVALPVVDSVAVPCVFIAVRILSVIACVFCTIVSQL